MGLGSQLHTQAEDAVVPQVKPKELLNRTWVFSLHRDVCKPNPRESRNWSDRAVFRKRKITELCHISYLAPGFCIGCKNPRKHINGAASVACLLSWDWQNQVSPVLPGPARTGGIPDVNMHQALEKSPTSAQTCLVCGWNPRGKD